MNVSLNPLLPEVRPLKKGSFLGRPHPVLLVAGHQASLNIIHDAQVLLQHQGQGLILLWDIIRECGASDSDLDLIEKADALMCEVHKGKTRDSGEPYHFHPRAVALNLIREFGIRDKNMLCAALLHDVIEEDPLITRDFIAEEFNADIASLVDGVTKLGKQLGKARGIVNLQKLIAASAQDPRVAILKLADNLHNIRTISSVATNRGIRKAREIAWETLNVYALLAHVLGIRTIRNKLEEAALNFLFPDDMAQIRAMVVRKEKIAVGRGGETVGQGAERLKRQFYDHIMAMVDKLPPEVQAIANDFPLRVNIEIDKLSLPQLYRRKKRLEEGGKEVAEEELLVDYYGLNFVIQSGESDFFSAILCPLIAQAIAEVNPVIPNKYRNFISFPKPNNYRAILDVLDFGLHGYLRVSFRTAEMDNWARLGVLSGPYHDLELVRPLLDKTDQILKREGVLNCTEADVIGTLRGHAFQIVVKTPGHEIFSIPQGSTVADFAYRVNTVLGYEAVAGRVNGETVGLNHILKNGDFVVVLRERGKRPSPDSLRDVSRPEAQKQILAYLRRRQKYVVSRTMAVGAKSLAIAAREEFLRFDDIFASPLAAAVLKLVLGKAKPANGAMARLEQDVLPFQGVGDKSIAEKLGEEGIDLFYKYFSFVVGIGVIDSRDVVSEYIRIHKVLSSIIVDFFRLTALGQTVDPAEIKGRYIELAERIESEVGRDEIDLIKDPSWVGVLDKKDVNGVASAMVGVASFIGQILEIAQRNGEVDEFIKLANSDSTARVLPARIKIKLTCPNRFGLSRDIIGCLSDGLGIDIPCHRGRGHGESPAHFTFMIAPRSHLERQQVVNMLADFGEVEVEELGPEAPWI